MQHHTHAVIGFWLIFLATTLLSRPVGGSSPIWNMPCDLNIFFENSGHQQVDYDKIEPIVSKNQHDVTASHANQHAALFFSMQCSGLDLSLVHHQKMSLSLSLTRKFCVALLACRQGGGLEMAEMSLRPMILLHLDSAGQAKSISRGRRLQSLPKSGAQEKERQREKIFIPKASVGLELLDSRGQRSKQVNFLQLQAVAR